MFSLSRRALSSVTLAGWCRKAQLNSRSAETHTAARALFLNGAIAIPSNTRGCGLTPAFQFPLKAKIALSKALFRILIHLTSSMRGRRWLVSYLPSSVPVIDFVTLSSLELTNHVVIHVDNLLHSACLVVSPHRRPSLEHTPPRHVQSLAKTVCERADVPRTNPRSRNSSHDFANVTNIGGYHREVTRKGLLYRSRSPFAIRAEKHGVGRAVIPRHLVVRSSKHRNEFRVQ